MSSPRAPVTRRLGFREGHRTNLAAPNHTESHDSGRNVAAAGVETGAETRIPTSVVLARMLDEAPGREVTLAWLIGRLGERSFGIIMLLIALVGIVPGVAAIVPFLLVLPAIQMLLARNEPVLPRFVANRRISGDRLARLVARLVPVLRWMERFVRPRWRTPFVTTQRVLGVVILLLSATILAPIPFIHVIPLLVIILLAFAFLEGDGILLCIALVAAIVSILGTAAALWGTIEAGLQL